MSTAAPLRKKAAVKPRTAGKALAAQAWGAARVLARPAPDAAAEPLVRADLQREPMRLSASLKAIARAALKQPRGDNRAPRQTGSRAYPALDAAPGRYVTRAD